MNEEYYVDKIGNFLGTFVNGAKPPQGSIKVDRLPPNGRYKWGFASEKWLEPVIPYTEARIAEYPPIGDQLDEIWRALAAMDNLPESTIAMLENIVKIKEKHPKK